MQWMLHDRKNRVLEFKVEEHEIVDEMIHHGVFECTDGNGKKLRYTGLGAKIGSQWTLKIGIPDEVKLDAGKWSFVIISEPFHMKGQYIMATGFSRGMDFICHQAITRLIG